MTKTFFKGQPIEIQFRPDLRTAGGKLIYGGERGERGEAVHAASFLRQRLIVLDRALLGDAPERDRILAHEIFHFVWWKLPRATRRRYEALIREEIALGMPGEMGWSSEWRKQKLRRGRRLANVRPLREYLCESFCDTAAACLLGLKRHREITLAGTARVRRRAWMRGWMEESLAIGGLKI